ncbi:Kelch repeat-containing protein [Aestuariivivens sediminis]|uniref:Kelch repeat-containing protein n=1 Tax=Aestuariivivens sediminis TaxID=2913557 RepID=UPI001F5AB747|nr:kelch repeat-containing protein [Aestuariivivens sediminis]
MNKGCTHIIFILILSYIFFLFPWSDIKGQEAETPVGPGARWGHVLIYDPGHDHILLFGGTNKKGGAFLSDTWIWKQNKWKKIAVSGPSARGFCAVTFYKGRNSIILHGGRRNNRETYSDLWEWNGSDWYQLDKKSDFKADHHQMV